MSTVTYNIAGGDYQSAGAGSKRLKEILKRIGVEPKTVRRTMVAAYEAEMNVVIHARRGVMKIAVDPTQVDVSIEDEGPGIPDIERAMAEGYSTAPAAARELGFGAGMGLPNIRRNADQFSIQSTVDQGTQVRFRIFLQSQGRSASAPNSVHVAAERCRQCLLCLRACPTGAIRVRHSRPGILDHLCVDCTSCIQACQPEALEMPHLSEVPSPSEETVLVLPVSLLEQFGAGVAPQQVVAAIRDLGFRRVRLSDEWDAPLRAAVAKYAQDEAKAHPVVSPMCPAVVNLIRMRYPALISQVAPFLTPIEAAREELTVPHAVFVVVCPSQHTALQAPSLLAKIDPVSPGAMRQAILRTVRHQDPPPAQVDEAASPKVRAEGVLQVSGMNHVVKVLDEVENGLLDDCAVLELFACDQGCFGSPVWEENPFVARGRYESAAAGGLRAGDPEAVKPSGGAVRRTHALTARTGVRLDADMRAAIEKLARIDALSRRLPGRDCGVCGAPTCAALAEDVVLGRVGLEACIYLEGQASAPGPDGSSKRDG